MNRRNLLLSSATALALTASLPHLAKADEPMPVVATFSILGDMVARIGGEHIELRTLVGADGDTHVYQPTPADARAVSEAQMLFVNGLEFEGWLERLAEAASFNGTLVETTTGIDLIAYDEHGHDVHDNHAEHKHDDHDDHVEHAEHKHGDDGDHAEHAEHEHDDHAGHDHGAFDPHGWQSLPNAVIYVDNITAACAKADPANAAGYYDNRAAYVAEIEALDTEIREMFAALPEDRRTVVTSHDAFQYFGRDYGFSFLAPQGLSTESEASAKDVAKLIEQMRAENISAVFVENITDPRLIEQIAKETGAVVGGTLFPGALSKPDGPAATYLEMIRHNATTLIGALGS